MNTQFYTDKFNTYVNTLGLNSDIAKFHGIVDAGVNKLCKLCDKTCKNSEKHILTKKHLEKAYSFTCNICNVTCKSYKARYNHELSKKHRKEVNEYVSINQFDSYDKCFVNPNKQNFTCNSEQIRKYETQISKLENEIRQKDVIISHHNSLFQMMIIMMEKTIQKIGGDAEIQQMFEIFKAQVHNEQKERNIEQRYKTIIAPKIIEEAKHMEEE